MSAKISAATVVWARFVEAAHTKAQIAESDLALLDRTPLHNLAVYLGFTHPVDIAHIELLWSEISGAAKEAATSLNGSHHQQPSAHETSSIEVQTEAPLAPPQPAQKGPARAVPTNGARKAPPKAAGAKAKRGFGSSSIQRPKPTLKSADSLGPSDATSKPNTGRPSTATTAKRTPSTAATARKSVPAATATKKATARPSSTGATTAKVAPKPAAKRAASSPPKPATRRSKSNESRPTTTTTQKLAPRASALSSNAVVEPSPVPVQPTSHHLDPNNNDQAAPSASVDAPTAEKKQQPKEKLAIGDLKPIFEAYGNAPEGTTVTMDLGRFMNYVKQCHLLDKQFRQCDAEALFRRFCSSNGSSNTKPCIHYHVFRTKVVPEMASKMHTTILDIVKRSHWCGPPRSPSPQ